MQLLIKVKLEQPLTLPIAYHQIIQGIIYQSLKDDSDFSHDLHERRNSHGKRNYKLFCFSDFSGPHRITKGAITFFDFVQFEVRSIDATLILRLEHHISSYGFTLNDQQYFPEVLKRSDNVIKNKKMKISMLSPVTLYTTSPETRKTLYLNPLDETFNYQLNENLRRKFFSSYNREPDATLKLDVLNLATRNRCVTKFKTTIIKGWYGDYQLESSLEVINFLYNTGLGSKNSQGFGLFEQK